MNQLTNLKNTYFALRHGLSEANVAGIIISHPDNGLHGYGLTELGKEQVKKSVTLAKEQKLLNEHTIIISSPFKRAKETAKIAKEILGVKEVAYRTELQERSFGLLEKTFFDYHLIWEKDTEDPTHTTHAVESMANLQKRMLAFIHTLEQLYNNKIILLVSHGDPLHILHAGLAKVPLKKYRIIPYLENAEIRKLP